MAPYELPLFPLGNVVLFPGVFLPLHVFEMRYRAMVKDVLAADRLIGIVLQRPGWQGNGGDAAPIYGVGCAGLVTHVESIEDGRYNIVLRGVERFRVVSEHEGRPYRVAAVQYLADSATPDERAYVSGRRRHLETLLASADTPDLPFPSTLSDEEVVNALSQYLDLQPIERQALLERPGVAARCEGLIDLLEMRSLVDGHPSDRGLVH
jgi:hypothetical protein